MTLAPLVFLVALLAIAGILLWLVEQFPIDATIKKLIHGVVIAAVAIYLVLWVLSFFGYGPGIRFH